MNDNILIVEDDFIIATDLREILERAGYTIGGIAPTVERALDLIQTNRPSWVFLDIYLIGRQTGIDLARQLAKMRIPFIYISANSNQSILEASKATNPFGFLVKPFREKDVLITFDVARYRHNHDLETKLLQEFELQEQVMDIIAETPANNDRLLKIITALQWHIPFTFLSITWQDNQGISCDGQGFLRTAENCFSIVDNEDIENNLRRLKKDTGPWKKCSSPDAKAISYTDRDFPTMCLHHSFDRNISQIYNLSSALMKTIRIADWGILTFSCYSRSPFEYTREQVVLLDRLGLLLVKIADCIPRFHTMTAAGDPSERSRSALMTPVNTDKFGLIGSNTAFELIKEQLVMVGPFDISVLILGESGTGKERVAQAIHRLSSRASKTLIKVNCGAIPASLIESELFGHEKGAFTGAQDRRIGKFEQAIGGTIFLDEIAELPPDLQVKLLSVLQEKEIVRVGGNEIIKTDVRVIAATNKNLEKEIADGRFRLDLYYRLNVFPISLPPLRERKDDIPHLVKYFLKQIAAKIGRNAVSISQQAMDDLVAYHWPGNIRELENIIERSMVLAEDNGITGVTLPDLGFSMKHTAESAGKIKTIKELEKDHIHSVLVKCNGRVSGAGGAAEILDLPPNTLLAKMKKLGIVKDYS